MKDAASYYDAGKTRNIGLKTIAIPSTYSGQEVRKISHGSFSYLGDVEKIVIPETVTEIDDFAFSDSRSLTNIIVPKSVTVIGSYAFYKCSSLTDLTISSGITRVEGNAFNGCASLTNLIIPDSVTYIGNGAFSWCTSLESINVDLNNAVYASVDGILLNKEKTKVIRCPEGKTACNIPSSVTRIDERAFAGCKCKVYVPFKEGEGPDGLSSSSNYYTVAVFYQDTLLRNITVPDGTIAIENGAYRDDVGITGVSIPNSVTSIGNWAFSECSSLSSITIPNSVTSIGANAFSECTNLKYLYIPTNVNLENMLEWLITTANNQVIEFETDTKPDWWTQEIEDVIKEMGLTVRWGVKK